MTGFGCGGTGWEEQGSPTGYSSSGGVVTITDALNVGGTALAVASGDAAFGSATTLSAFWDSSAGTFYFYGGGASPYQAVTPGAFVMGQLNKVRWTDTNFSTGTVDLSLDRGASGVLKVSDPTNGADSEIRVYNSAASSYVGLTIGGTNASLNIGGTTRLQFNSGSLTPNGNLTLGTAAAPWSDANIARSANLALLTIKSNSEELTALSGASASTTNLVPAGCTILYVVARVTTLIEGATTFDVGDGSDVDRYGAAIALAAGTTVDETDGTADPRSWSASAQNVTLTANGSNFTAGAVRITAFYLDPTAPTS